MRRVLMLSTLMLLAILALKLGTGVEAQENDNSQPTPTTGSKKIPREVRKGLKQLNKHKDKIVKPGHSQAQDTSIFVGTKTRTDLMKTRSSTGLSLQTQAANLPPISAAAPASQIIITSDFRATSNSGGAMIALRDSNGDGNADQSSILASNVVFPGDAITKIAASQVLFGRYYALTEDNELIQVDDVDKDYQADRVVALDDFVSERSLGIGITTTLLSDGSEAVYILSIEPGPDDLFFTNDDSAAIFGFFDTNNNGEIDSVGQVLRTISGFSSFGGLSTGVENSLLFSLAKFDSGGRVIDGAIYSYVDINGDEIPDDFASNGNNGIFTAITSSDPRPGLATDIAAAGTSFYVVAPLKALGVTSNNDDIVIYRDLNASQTADSQFTTFITLSGLNGFSSDLNGLAVSPDGTQVAIARNEVLQGDVQSSQLFLMYDGDFNQRADNNGALFFDNGFNGIAGICFGNADLVAPQPIVIFPRLRNTGKFSLNAVGAHIQPGAMLVVDSKEKFTLKLNKDGTRASVVATAKSSPGNLTIKQVLTKGNHKIEVRNTDSIRSLPATITIN